MRDRKSSVLKRENCKNNLTELYKKLNVKTDEKL